MSLPSLDVGDVREVWKMLGRLTPWGRVDFLRWCCRQANRGGRGCVPGREVHVRPGHSGTVNEAIMDLQMLEFQHGLSMTAALEELNRRLRRT